MKYKIYTINIIDNDTKELNNFVSSHRIVNIKKSLVTQEDQSYWSFLIEYVEKEINAERSVKYTGKATIDYKDLLSEEDFTKYVRLKELRKELSEKNKIAVYNVFNNAQLAEMITAKAKTKADLSKISGVGDSKLEKFGEDFLKVLVKINR